MSRTARTELIRIQRELADQVRSQVESVEGRPSAALRAYREAHAASVARFGSVSSRRDLVERMVDAELVVIGDYHTLRQAQEVPRRLTEALLALPAWRARPRPVLLGLEMVHIEHQAALDDFLAGRIREDALRGAIRYAETWGFPWEASKALLEFAGRHDIRVIALNSTPGKVRNPFRARDRRAAERLAEAIRFHPDALFIVLFGELHVAGPHLPAEIDRAVRRLHLRPRRTTIIHQNLDRTFDEVREAGHFPSPDVVLLEDGSYCILNTPPLAKYQSYLNWLDREEELYCPAHADWCDVGEDQIDLTSQVADIIQAICRFLRLPAPPRDRLTVSATHDPDLLDSLRRELGSEALDEIRGQIHPSDGILLPGAHVILLTNLSYNHAAEQASLYLHATLVHQKTSPPPRPQDAFYGAVLHEAIAFFGSRILNPKRSCAQEADYRDLLGETRGRRDRPMGHARTVARLLLRHRDREQEYLATGAWRPLRGVYQRPPEERLGVARALGAILGDRLADGIASEMADRGLGTDLFRKDYRGRGEALRFYLEMIRRLRTVPPSYERRAERI